MLQLGLHDKSLQVVMLQCSAVIRDFAKPWSLFTALPATHLKGLYLGFERPFAEQAKIYVCVTRRNRKTMVHFHYQLPIALKLITSAFGAAVARMKWIAA